MELRYYTAAYGKVLAQPLRYKRNVNCVGMTQKVRVLTNVNVWVFSPPIKRALAALFSGPRI
jgi:hypothetical protein